ncbi:hypothetical protein [Streptomyces sp. NPDC000880]
MADPSGAGSDLAEPDDLFVLGGEAGQGLGAEVRELVDRLLGLGEPFLELGVLFLEPGDLGLARSGISLASRMAFRRRSNSARRCV